MDSAHFPTGLTAGDAAAQEGFRERQAMSVSEDGNVQESPIFFFRCS